MNGAVLFRNVPVLRTACIFEVYTDTVKKSTGIVRRMDDPGRIVIFKEIHHTLRIREGDPLLKTLRVEERYLWAMELLQKRFGGH